MRRLKLQDEPAAGNADSVGEDELGLGGWRWLRKGVVKRLPVGELDVRGAVGDGSGQRLCDGARQWRSAVPAAMDADQCDVRGGAAG